MAEKSIFTDREIAFLRELVKQEVPFIIVGLSAAALQGAPVVTQDVDLWFENIANAGIAKALKKSGGSYIPPTIMNPPLFAGKNVALFDIVLTMHGIDSFPTELKGSIEIKLGSCKVRVLPLERIIKSKEALMRPKDKLVLPVLKDALETILASKKR